MTEVKMIELRPPDDWTEDYIRSIAEEMGFRSIIVQGITNTGKGIKVFSCCWTNHRDSAQMIDQFLADEPKVMDLVSVMQFERMMEKVLG